MSGLVSVRSYFRTNMDALDYREWKDGFTFNNIPSTLLDGSYHIETVAASRRGAYDHQAQDIEVPVVLRVFQKGYRYPADAIDDSLTAMDAILSRLLEPSRRCGGSIKNVIFNDMKISPVALSNDNAAILEMSFNCLIIFS